MTFTLKTLSQELGAEFNGNEKLVIDHACGMDNLSEGGLAYIANPKELSSLPTPEGVFDSREKSLEASSDASTVAFIVPKSTKYTHHNVIFADDPLEMHVRATLLIHTPHKVKPHVDSRAIIGKKVKLGKQVMIHAGAVIYDEVSIGDHSVIHAGVVVMRQAEIGSDCVLFPNVTLAERTKIGNRVVIHPSSVIGSDGFGFYQRDKLNKKIPQIGRVLIEDDVEIGSCCAIDRARFSETIIKSGCKLDNLIHIAHNVELGENSLIAAQSGIAGSTKTGNHLMMGGQSGIRDNLEIGSHVTLLARTLISSKTRDEETVAGMPSRPIAQWREIQAKINSLKSLYDKVHQIEQALKQKGLID
ncbi:MAG: UDP-3-O-(3-hydroxymyristoyl)glucosamine N-acyltransferase [Deltaproteobacteria bacterium]|nr:UDP-3-O-(3-hydroxymyristoyl)glucosamine N-acyltransferase [Deltaproteobacteria bacterium]